MFAGDVKKELALSDDEDDDEQYKQMCGNGCGTMLTKDTPIMCYSNEEKGDKTLCDTCYWEAEYWKDDENEDNEEEVRAYKDDDEDDGA